MGKPSTACLEDENTVIMVLLAFIMEDEVARATENATDNNRSEATPVPFVLLNPEKMRTSDL